MLGAPSTGGGKPLVSHPHLGHEYRFNPIGERVQILRAVVWGGASEVPPKKSMNGHFSLPIINGHEKCIST